MEKNTAGLVGMIASLATMGTAQAATHSGQPHEQVMRVSSYAELLKPIPNATELLKASNAELLQKAQARVQEVQYYNYNEGPPPPPPGYGNGYDHHHHHHHHAYYPPPPPPPDYHHHHHHHNGVTIVVPGLGVVRGGG